MFIRFLYLQLGCVSAAGLVYWQGYQTDHFSLKILSIGFFVAIQTILAMFMGRLLPVHRRLLDIYYPEFRPSLLTNAWLLFPVVGAVFLVFLLKSERKPEQAKLPFIFRRPKASAALALLAFTIIPLILMSQVFLLGGYASGLGRLTYWMNDPTTHYISSLAEEVSAAIEIKNKVVADPAQYKAVALFQELSKRRSISSTGIVMMNAAVVLQSMKEKKAAELAGTPVGPVQVRFVEDLISVVELSDKRPLAAFSFNPLSFLTPAGAVPAALIALVALAVDEKTDESFLAKLRSILDKVPADTSALRARLEKTRTYQSLQQRDSWPIDQSLRRMFFETP
ncbi:MAG: hypothetical protein A2X94_12410 [Bdellovibrionales bacterium GWB1_55_8]|nr:MAG: hypothetical protein A2X94_12410 [Bdellovibrionales bacterium GWB1_55_8]